MAINPSNISLKGLYLDLGSTVGGTRNVYNNGVMCAKNYVRFSYRAAEGDVSTVADIVQWLVDNGELRVCSESHADAGTLSD